MWRLGRKVTNSWKTAPVYLKNRSGPTNPIDFFPAVSDLRDRGSAMWVRCHFGLRQAVLWYHKDAARGRWEALGHSTQMAMTALSVELPDDPGSGQQVRCWPTVTQPEGGRDSTAPSSLTMGAKVFSVICDCPSPGIRDPALTLSGNCISSKAVPGWPLRAASGVRESRKSQVAVRSPVWTRIS